MANEFVQTMSDARVDARSLSEFVFKPAGFKVTRRLAPPVDTLQFYIDRFDATKATTDAYVTTIPNIVSVAINNAVISSGFVTIDSFELGATITQRNQALRHAADGKLYRWAGDLPKVVPASSTPVSTGGFGANAWLEVSDTMLRQELTSVSGAALIPHVAASFNTVSQMVAADWLPEGMRVTTAGYYNIFDAGGNTYTIATSNKTPDGGSVIALSNGLKAIADFGNEVHLAKFGTKDGQNADAQIDAASMYLRSIGGGELILPSGDIVLTQSYDGRKYNYNSADGFKRVIVSIRGKSSRVIWRGGLGGTGAYGTVFHMKRSNLNSSGVATTEGAFLGCIKDVQIIADQIEQGHLGGWALTGQYATLNSSVAGCKLPSQDTYPINVAPTINLSALADDAASCAIYYMGVTPTAATGNIIQKFAFGIWAGEGFGSDLRSNYIKWCNCAIALRSAITRTTVKDNICERNAVGFYASVASHCSIENNIMQANYAGCDILLGVSNLEHTFKENYHEISPKNIVIRGAGGDVRNSNIKFIRNHGIQLDIDMAYVDTLQFRHNLFARDAELVFANTGNVAKKDACIFVEDNRIPYTGDSNFEEMYPIFTNYPMIARKWIVDEGKAAASESLTDEAYYGREQRYKGSVKTEVSKDFCRVRVPNTQCNGIIKVSVTKSRAKNTSIPLSTLYNETYFVGYAREAGSPTTFAIAAKTEGAGEIKIDPLANSVSRKESPVSLSGGVGETQYLTISEAGAVLSVGAMNVTLEVVNHATTGESRIEALL